jgi:hypothetical protein
LTEQIFKMIGARARSVTPSGCSGRPEGIRRLSTLSRRMLIAARKATSVSVTGVPYTGLHL